MLAALVALIALLVHLSLVLLAAPLLAGVVAWIDARLAGRAGPPLLDPLRELIRLTRKAPALPENASAILAIAPALSFAATLSAAALVPSFTLGMALSPLADGLVLASLLTIGRVAACLGALDIGAAASGRAAEHSNAIAILAEPALLLLVFSVALMGGSFNLDHIVVQQREGLLQPAAASAVALTCLVSLAFAELAASAPDLAGDLSGIDLAVARFTAWLRRIVWINLVGALFLPIGMAGPEGDGIEWAIGLLAWLLKLAAATICLSLAQIVLGRPSRQSLPNLLGVAALLALLATLIALSGAGAA